MSEKLSERFSDLNEFCGKNSQFRVDIYALLDLDRCVLVPDVLLLLLVDVCGEHLHLHCQRPGIQEGLQALPQGCVHVYTGCFNGC